MNWNANSSRETRPWMRLPILSLSLLRSLSMANAQRRRVFVRLALIGLTMPMLAACAGPPARAPLERQLPPVPSFARAVAVPEPKRGEYLLVIAKRERDGRLEANARIIAFREWYGDLVRAYAGEAPSQ